MIVCASSVSAAEADAPAWQFVKSDEMTGPLPPLGDQLNVGAYKDRIDELGPMKAPRRKVLFQDALISTLYETEYYSTRSFDFPADEIVYVLSGRSTFVDEPSGRKTTMRPGDLFVVPRHWRGVWTMQSDGGKPYREFTAFSTYDWAPQQQPFDRADLTEMPAPPGVLKVGPLSSTGDLEPLADEPGRLHKADPRKIRGRVLSDGNPVLRMYEAPDGAILRKTGPGCDELIHVAKGRLLVTDQSGRRGEVGSGGAVVLKAAFIGEIQLGRGFRGTVAATAAKAPDASGSAASSCPKF
jgi:uncharacterized cupin superfamily protein